MSKPSINSTQYLVNNSTNALSCRRELLNFQYPGPKVIPVLALTLNIAASWSLQPKGKLSHSSTYNLDI